MFAVKETDILLMEAFGWGHRPWERWFFMEDGGKGLAPLKLDDGSWAPAFATEHEAVAWIMKTAGDDVQE